MRILMLVAVLAFWAGSAAASAAERPIILISSDNVDLAGAGRVSFTFEAEKAGLPPGRSAPSGPVDLKLWFDATGGPLRCVAEPGSASFTDRICSQLLASAKFGFAPGFGLPLKQGFVRMRGELRPVPAVELTRARFGQEQRGERRGLPTMTLRGFGDLPFMVNMLAAADQPGGRPRCAAQGMLPTPPQYEKAVCDVVLADEAAAVKLCQKVNVVASITVLQCAVKVRSKRSSPPELLLVEHPGYANADIRYPANKTPPGERLTALDGRLNLEIGFDDYPSMALREGFTGTVEILLGVRRDGSIADCRPLQSTGAALLDNETCALAIRRGSFLFSDGTAAYEGLRYVTFRLGWQIPQ